MFASPSIDALRDAIAPMEALRGEQSQLETWVRESFAALDALHADLNEWQRDLTRQQALLDQREAHLAEVTEHHDADVVAKFERQLAQARDDAQQLEEENAEQLQAIDALERQLAIAQTELRVVRKHSDDLAAAFEMERERAAEEHGNWTTELREYRRLLERQSATIEHLTGQFATEDGPPLAHEGDAGASHGGDDGAAATADDVAARRADLRRRANSRRAAHRRTT